MDLAFRVITFLAFVASLGNVFVDSAIRQQDQEIIEDLEVSEQQRNHDENTPVSVKIDRYLYYLRQHSRLHSK